MKTIEQTRRALFEAWDRKTFCESEHEQDGEGGYQDNIVNQCWMAFNAALDAVVIELPAWERYDDEDMHGASCAIQDCRSSIESTNLGLKIR